MYIEYSIASLTSKKQQMKKQHTHQTQRGSNRASGWQPVFPLWASY